MNMAKLFSKVLKVFSKQPSKSMAPQDEQRLKFALENSPDGLWDWNLITNEVYFSSRWKEMLGFAGDELEGSAEEWENRIHPGDLPRVKNVLDDHLMGKTPVFNCEYRVRCSDGSFKWVFDHAVVVSRDTAGKPLLLIGSYTDITYRRLYEERINSLVTRFESATHAAKFGVLEWDLLKNTISADRQFYSQYGAEAEDFSDALGGWLKHVHPSERDHCEQELRYALIARQQFIITFQVLWPNGTVHSLKIATDIIRNEVGKPIKMLGVQWDVTREQEIDRQKSEFVSLASHQLRTPLTSIRWFTELLLDDKTLSREQKDYVKEIYKGDLRMIDLVDALLNVSRLELGTFTINPRRIDIIEMMKSVLKELKPQILSRSVNVVETYDEKLHSYIADPNLIRIIFLNPLTNAVKYTKKDGTVSVNLAINTKGSTVGGMKLNRDCLTMTIKDTGIGIPQKQQSKIYSKLFRAENAQIEQTEGTGLGLYLLKEIVEQSGGATWFISKENEGTSFFVVLPAAGMTKMSGPQH